MNREDVIRMAREAGGYDSLRYPENLVMDEHDLKRFAEIIAAREREACAKVCELRYMGDNNREDMEARRCAAAIRSRGIK